MSVSPRCPWCGGPFRPRQDGGQQQKFCRSSCRRAFHAAARAWALAAIASGALAPVDVRSGPAATRTLLLCGEEQTRQVRRGSVALSLSVLPDVIEDLGRWAGSAVRGASTMLLQMLLWNLSSVPSRSGYDRRDRLTRNDTAGWRKSWIASPDFSYGP